jgi:hypothetical protein
MPQRRKDTKYAKYYSKIATHGVLLGAFVSWWSFTGAGMVHNFYHQDTKYA